MSSHRGRSSTCARAATRKPDVMPPMRVRRRGVAHSGGYPRISSVTRRASSRAGPVESSMTGGRPIPRSSIARAAATRTAPG